MPPHATYMSLHRSFHHHQSTSTAHIHTSSVRADFNPPVQERYISWWYRQLLPSVVAKLRHREMRVRLRMIPGGDVFFFFFFRSSVFAFHLIPSSVRRLFYIHSREGYWWRLFLQLVLCLLVCHIPGGHDTKPFVSPFDLFLVYFSFSIKYFIECAYVVPVVSSTMTSWHCSVMYVCSEDL